MPLTDSHNDGCNKTCSAPDSGPPSQSVLNARLERRCADLEKELADALIRHREDADGARGVIRSQQKDFGEYRDNMSRRIEHQSQIIVDLRGALEIVGALNDQNHVRRVVVMALEAQPIVGT